MFPMHVCFLHANLHLAYIKKHRAYKYNASMKPVSIEIWFMFGYPLVFLCRDTAYHPAGFDISAETS